MQVSILNLCGGKILPELEKEQFPYFLLNLDLTYFTKNTIEDVRSVHFKFIEESKFNKSNIVKDVNYDVYQFLERYDIPFDSIAIYRFLEHVPKSNVLYFIYLLSTCCKKRAILDIIVPDSKKLAKRILTENPFDKNFEAEDIITTYEMLNDMPSPHLSLWSKDRIKYFFELEGRFKILNIEDNYNFDGRDIYLRSIIERV
jgi:hypothetical protein